MAVAAARRKPTEKRQMWSAPKQPTERCGQEEPKPMVKVCGQKLLQTSKKCGIMNMPI